jgi:aerobic carbon-monoxide dehydrogenase large subunit
MTTRYAGSRVQRVEDARLLTGHGTFVDDVTRPGMLHATFVRSPHARARITGIDAAEARAAAGVHAVLLPDDLNPLVQALWYTVVGPKSPTTPLPPLADREARFVGDPVALVIAEDRYLAEDAAELVVVDYAPLPPVVDYTAPAPEGAVVHEGYDGNLVGKMSGGNRDGVEAALAEAPHVVEHVVRQQMYAAVPMETRGLVVEWDAPSGELTIWSATQAPHEVRAVCSRVTGLDEHRIRVIMRDTGGGFGQKVVPLREELAIMLASRLVPAPIKWIEDRRENLLAAGQARHESATVRFGFDEEGTILAASIDHNQDVGAYPVPWPVGTGAAVGMLFPGPYRMPLTSFRHRSFFSNTPGRTAYRGPWAFESLAREVSLDVAARKLGMDPIELRRRNVLRADELPCANGNGMPYADMAPAEVLEHALALLGLEDFRRQQEAARAEGRYLGVGTCSYVEPTTPGIGHYASEGATIRIEPTGKVNVYVAGGSTGNSLETTVVQLTADALGVPIEDVRTIQGDTALTPYGGGTGGSRSGTMLAGAVQVTAGVLAEKLRAIAAHKLEASPDDIELVGGQATVRGTPAIGVPIAELADIAYHQTHALPPGTSSGLEASERHTTSMMPVWANATHVCTCEVDVRTGEVKLLRYIVAEDCGPMINPSVVEGQVAGGTIQGIGGALLEELAFDEDGNPLATTFMDYLLPTATEVPTIEYGHDVVTPASAAGGYKGVGEGGAIGAPPAVVNAVADALAPFGVVVERLPLSPQAVIALLER